MDSGWLWKTSEGVPLTRGAGGWAEGLKVRRNRLKNSWLDGEERELPFAANVNQAAGMEFLDVVGKCGRRDGEGVIGIAATKRATGLRNSLQEFESLWIGESLENGSTLGTGEARGLRRLS